MPSSVAYTAKCLHCGRVRRFHSAEAAASAKPYGRICGMRVRLAAIAEAVKGFTETQIDRAKELIADGGLVPTNRPGVFRAVSSDGERTYLTTKDTCNCPSGLKRLLACTCKHSLGARILAAAA